MCTRVFPKMLIFIALRGSNIIKNILEITLNLLRNWGELGNYYFQESVWNLVIGLLTIDMLRRVSFIRLGSQSITVCRLHDELEHRMKWGLVKLRVLLHGLVPKILINSLPSSHLPTRCLLLKSLPPHRLCLHL